MDRLEAVADIRERASHDHAHRVIEVARPHLVLDADASGCRPGRRSRCATPRGHERWFGECGGVGQAGRAAEAGRGLGGGRGGRRVGPLADAGEPLAELGGDGRIELGQAVADDPGAVAVVGRGRRVSVSARSASAVASASIIVSDRYAHERAFWTSGSASPMSWARIGRARAATSGWCCRPRLTWVIVAIVEPTRRRSQRDGEKTSCSSSAQRYVSAIDALGVRMGERIDRDPVVGLARGPAEELPGALGLGRERPLEQAEGEPAGFEAVLAEQAVGDEQERRGPILAGGLAEAARDRGHQRPADAVDRPDARGDPLGALEVLRIGEALEAAAQGRPRRRPDPRCRSARSAPRVSASGLWAATNSMARAVVGLGVVGRRSRARASSVGSAASVAVRVHHLGVARRPSRSGRCRHRAANRNP